MKLAVTAIAVVGMVGMTLPAVASDELAKKHACFACHTVDKKMVGPSYKDVAAKYKGKQGAEGELVAKLKAAKGHPKTPATEAELQVAVREMLAAK